VPQPPLNQHTLVGPWGYSRHFYTKATTTSGWRAPASKPGSSKVTTDEPEASNGPTIDTTTIQTERETSKQPVRDTGTNNTVDNSQANTPNPTLPANPNPWTKTL